MRASLLISALLAGMLLWAGAPVRAQVTAEQVRASIEAGVNYLKSQQNKTHGNWPEHGSEPGGGLSALCTLALLTAGEDVNSPAIQRALNYLRSLPAPKRTYSTALQTMVFALAEPEKDRALIARNVRHLEEAQVKTGAYAGTWGYLPSEARGDNSNTQFALLGLYEAERVGVAVDPQVWERSLRHFQQTQRDDGSWSYYEQGAPLPPLPSTGSMTCAGLGSLLICADRLAQGEARVTPSGDVACCGATTADNHIERALAWLGRYGLSTNPGGEFTWHLYYLYGIERVGRLSGRRFLGQHDWYREGAQLLVSRQDKLNGQWRGAGPIESNADIATSFALLFLAKGRRPVVISQLDWQSQPGASDWERHPAAIHKLTRHVERQWKQELTWQTITLQDATVADLLQSPVLFLRGTQAITLSEAEKQALREYIDQGGFIFAEACDGAGCDGRAFDTSFRELMAELFPDAPLRELPPDHAVWFAEAKVDPEHLPDDFWLYGVDACRRTSVIYATKTLSCYWEVSAGARKAPYNDAAAQRVEAALNLGQNVLAYATNRELRDKLDVPDIRVREGSDALVRGTLYVPKLSHGGGSDDAPNALANLLHVAREQLELRVNTERRLLAPTDIELLDYPIVFMHGRRAFRFTPAERQALAQYLERGGFVFADAICASPQFAAAFRREFEAMFPAARFVRIPPDHPLFTDQYRGQLLSRVTLRDPQVRREGDPLQANLTQITPVLEGLEIDGRLAVIFSPYDLSCGLENQSSLECRGYVKADAARIGLNILLYALGQ